MKQKYIIRETSIPYLPPYTPLYFHGFTTRGSGICMVFNTKLAAEYDTLKAAQDTMVKVKELSGRDTWDVDPKFGATKPTAYEPRHRTIACRHCGHPLNYHGLNSECPV